MIMIIVVLLRIIIHWNWFVYKVCYTTSEQWWYLNTTHSKHLEHWSRKNAPARQSEQTSIVGAIKIETLSVIGKKAGTARPALLKMNEAGNSFRKFRGGQVPKTQKWMHRVSNIETMLKCKTNRWRLVYLTWNIIIFQDNNSDLHGFRTGFTRWELYILTTILLYLVSVQVRYNLIWRFKVMPLDPTNSNIRIHPRKSDTKA